MLKKEEILSEFSLFSLGTGGIGSWLTEETRPEIVDRLARIDTEPLTRAQLNQLLVLGHEAPVSEGFFRYYWLSNPAHPYDVTRLPGFTGEWTQSEHIRSRSHLKWGLYRLFTDSLLWFGNVRTGYRHLRSLNCAEIKSFFQRLRFDTDGMQSRGPALPLRNIAKDHRYLIAEMACKSYGEEPGQPSELKKALLGAMQRHLREGGGRIPILALLQGDFVSKEYSGQQKQFIFSAEEVLSESVESTAELEEKYERIANEYSRAREAALDNTAYYLSMAGDLDVYVATSMRKRDDFRSMADKCEKIFSDKRLADLELRHFDPTLSAAKGHEDKGLIECLMVKCAKALVYCAGETDSYGKDAEAAMALSLGKSVIFLCDEELKKKFYRDVHPLSRLIDFKTGVAVGAMVTDRLEDVAELLRRIFTNTMEYELERPRGAYLRLKETLTGSVVRLQTDDRLLSETFWNHYHARRQE